MSDYTEYLKKIKAAESGGNKYAKNPFPKQTASGIFQFTKGTWQDLGFDWKDRYDENKQYEAVNKFTNLNANYFKKNFKKEPTHADLYGMHWLGAAGYKKLYNADENASISEVMSDNEIAVNPTYTKNKNGSLKTVAEVRAILKGKTGEGVTPSTQLSPQEQPQAGYVGMLPNGLPDVYGQPYVAEEKVKEEETAEAPKRTDNANKLGFVADYEELAKQYEQQLQAQQKPILQQEIVEGVQYQPIQQNFQEGGIKIDPQGYWNPDNEGKPVIIPSPHIDMQNVSFPVLGTSLETGEQRLMTTNNKYFFANTKNVLEEPLKNYEKK